MLVDLDCFYVSVERVRICWNLHHDMGVNLAGQEVVLHLLERLEQERLDSERLEKQRQFSSDYNVVVVLKGAHTSITNAEGFVYFNSTGNPGMSTAGSGDVLTGILTALISQTYSALEAAILGVFIHGCAGDMAASEKGQTGMIANDIIAHLPQAFKKFEK